jgi:hypothetical protein
VGVVEKGVGRCRWVQLLLPAHSWKRPFLTAFSPETHPFSRASYPINLVRSCVRRWKRAEKKSWKSLLKKGGKDLAEYRGYWLGPTTFFGPWPLSRDADVQFALYFISFFRIWNGVEIIIISFKWSVRAEVVTYRLDVVIGSLHTQQLHGFDELRNDQGIIQNHRPGSTQNFHHFICPNH